jgi:glycerophosphoryl diester phosphodiesterase
MSSPISITRNGHVTWFKWHRGRRRLSDPVFTGRRILEAMALGASIEVDLVVTGDKGFAVLHDKTLDRETTGQGPVARTSDDVIRQLRLRDNAGAAITEPVMLLDDLCTLMASGTVHPDALLQLDYKEDETVLDGHAIANFRRATLPVAKNIIVSSGSAAAVKLLTDAVPGMQIGYDPCRDDSLATLRRTGDFAGFVADALAASPDAGMIYLAWEIAIAADTAGFDMIGACHAGNRRVDCWTIKASDPASVATVERLLALKVDQITTDDPEGLSVALGVPA